MYPLAPWTSRVVPGGPAPGGGGGGGRDGGGGGGGGVGGGGGGGGGGGDDRRPGVYVSVTVPRGLVPVLRARAVDVVDALSGREPVESMAARP